jgi:hypothetical protein
VAMATKELAVHIAYAEWQDSPARPWQVSQRQADQLMAAAMWANAWPDRWEASLHWLESVTRIVPGAGPRDWFCGPLPEARVIMMERGR